MAVELNRVSKDPTLSLFYHFEKKEQLEFLSNTVYTFPEDTTSIIKFHETEFKPVRIYLTTVLHKGFGSHDYELIVETAGNLFLCFGLKKNSQSDMSFPLKESPLEKILQRCTNANTLYYQTTGKSHVFYCKPDVYVGDDFPQVLDNAKAKYKEIFEPNAFDIFSNLFTRNDYKLKVISAAEGGQFRQYTPTITEGFVDSYMECELLENIDGKDNLTSEYTITPLKSNSYERGVTTIVIFTQFLLVLGVGGILLPWIQCYGKFEKVLPNTWFMIFSFLHICFLLVGVTMLIIGIIRNKYLIATIGFYFFILFLSNAVGMKIMFPSSALYKDTNENEKRNSWSFILYTIFLPMWYIKTP